MIKLYKLPFKTGGYTANDVVIFVGKQLNLGFAEAKARISSQSDISSSAFMGNEVIVGKYDGKIATFIEGRGKFPMLHSLFGFKPGMTVAVTFPDPSVRKKYTTRIDKDATFRDIMARLRPEAKETEDAAV